MKLLRPRHDGGMMSIRRLALLCFCLSLAFGSGCSWMVGPDFKVSEAPVADSCSDSGEDMLKTDTADQGL